MSAQNVVGVAPGALIKHECPLLSHAKSNEFTAIPALLKLLELHGALVTIDAIGCQKRITEEIISGGADYVLAVKDNQPTLHEDVVSSR